MKQTTLKAPFSVSGKGLHSGLNVEATFKPAPVNSGYIFKRIDLQDAPVIEALAENVTDTNRGTVIACKTNKDIKVGTIEHSMAALYAAGVDNCIIEINAPEMPILDGSAITYSNMIEEVGLEEQAADREFYVVKQRIKVVDEATGSSLIVLPDDEFSIDTMIEFDSPVLPNQFASLTSLADFKQEIAGSRTFVFVREIMPLVENNLIKGGDLDNAIVIYDKEMSQDELNKIADVAGVPHIPNNKLGYLNHKPLAHPNEPARHKLLDVMGDLALIGRPLKGRIVATRPGHTINTKLSKQIRKELRYQNVQAPVYDPNKEPVMDINRIRQLLPHRYPMQLVDKIISISGTTIVGVKNVTSNEPFFTGHFPEEPVMPGVLMVEAMSQCGAILVLNTLEDPERWTSYFLKIDNVKYRKKVVPGDTLIFKVELLGPVRHGISSMQGWIFVGDQLVAEATFTGQMVKNK
jgi:UDP-3-O-[3-hydroxymyristoyl] N-acetylglucosamine deacetylase/3-hydroxyacyl-[acyl-carrier-protein] dehydratase